MSRFLFRGSLSLIFLVLVIPAPSPGGSFSAVPVRVYFEKNARSAVLKVVNTGDARLTLQLKAVRWYQDEDGNDRNDPTNDVLFFPRMAHIEPGRTQVVRLGYEGPPAGPVERAYRLYLEELPVSRPGDSAVRMSVRMGLPIFIKADANTRLWTVERFGLSDGMLAAWIRNGGAGHIVVAALKTAAFDDSGAEVFSRKASGWYILPGITKKHVLQLSRDECLKAATLTLEAESDGSVVKAKLIVDKTMCPKEAETPPSPGSPRIPKAGADGG